MYNNDELNELSKINLNDVNDEELRSLITKVNTYQLSLLASMSAYYCINGYLTIDDSLICSDTEEKINLGEEFFLIRKYYERIPNFINQINNFDISNVNPIDKLLDLRGNLGELLTDIEPYLIESSYLVEKFDYYLLKKIESEEYKGKEVTQNEVNNFINLILNYLMKYSKDYRVFEDKISRIVGILPFRLSKEKFLEIVEDTVRRNISAYNKSILNYEIKNYKKIFDSTLEPSFGISYDYYFRKVIHLKKQGELKKYKVEELKLYLEDSKILYEEIEHLSNEIRNMGIIVNKLICIYLIKSKGIDFALDEEIFKMWKEKNKDIKNYLNIMTKMEEEMSKANSILENMSIEALNRENIINEKLSAELSFTKKVLTYYNDISIPCEEILFIEEENLSKPDSDYIDEVIDNYIGFLNRSIKSLSNVERKLRMRRLLSNIEFPFERLEDFVAYVESSLDLRITSKEEIIMAMNVINHMITEDLNEK